MNNNIEKSKTLIWSPPNLKVDWNTEKKKKLDIAVNILRILVNVDKEQK